MANQTIPPHIARHPPNHHSWQSHQHLRSTEPTHSPHSLPETRRTTMAGSNSAPSSLISPSMPSTSSWTPTSRPQPRHSSVASLENARYHLDGIPTSEHPNEDRHFRLDGDNFKVFAVFDGHDGPRAAGFASHYFMEYFSTESWKSLTRAPLKNQKETIPLALKEFFKATEKEFFNSIRPVIEEKRTLQAIIPPDMNSYQAYQRYPLQVARLQELEPRIAGGTTVVIAVICNNTLYIANTGDSRAVLVAENEKGLQQAVQLSVDHSVENIDELRRLVALGLDRRQLESSGRLGSQENTRSIGDYYIKEGYRDVDTLRNSKGQPGLCEPHIRTAPITPDSKYLLLMTDGIYKSMEATFNESARIDSNKVLLSMLNRERERVRSFEVLSDRVIDRIRTIHEDTYKRHAKEDVRSPVAVSCRKRDDMTLLIHEFSTFTKV